MQMGDDDDDDDDADEEYDDYDDDDDDGGGGGDDDDDDEEDDDDDDDDDDDVGDVKGASADILIKNSCEYGVPIAYRRSHGYPGGEWGFESCASVCELPDSGCVLLELRATHRLCI